MIKILILTVEKPRCDTKPGFSLQFCFSHTPEGFGAGARRLEAVDGQKLFPMTNRDMLAVLRGPTLQWFGAQ